MNGVGLALLVSVTSAVGLGVALYRLHVTYFMTLEPVAAIELHCFIQSLFHGKIVATDETTSAMQRHRTPSSNHAISQRCVKVNPQPKDEQILYKATDKLNPSQTLAELQPSHLSKQPNVPKQENHRREKPKPHPPPDARPLRHPQHPIHRTS